MGLLSRRKKQSLSDDSPRRGAGVVTSQTEERLLGSSSSLMTSTGGGGGAQQSMDQYNDDTEGRQQAPDLNKTGRSKLRSFFHKRVQYQPKANKQQQIADQQKESPKRTRSRSLDNTLSTANTPATQSTSTLTTPFTDETAGSVLDRISISGGGGSGNVASIDRNNNLEEINIDIASPESQALSRKLFETKQAQHFRSKSLGDREDYENSSSDRTSRGDDKTALINNLHDATTDSVVRTSSVANSNSHHQLEAIDLDMPNYGVRIVATKRSSSNKPIKVRSRSLASTSINTSGIKELVTQRQDTKKHNKSAASKTISVISPIVQQNGDHKEYQPTISTRRAVGASSSSQNGLSSSRDSVSVGETVNRLDKSGTTASDTRETTFTSYDSASLNSYSRQETSKNCNDIVFDHNMVCKTSSPIKDSDNEEGWLNCSPEVLAAFSCADEGAIDPVTKKPFNIMQFFYDPFCGPEDLEETPRRPFFDEVYTIKFLHEMVAKGVSLLYLVPSQQSSSEDDQGDDWKGHSVVLRVVKGTSSADNDMIQPHLSWSSMAGGRKSRAITTNISLLDILNISTRVEDDDDVNKSDQAELCFFTITTSDGAVHMFEAASPAQKEKIAVGLRNLVARLSFHLIVGSVTASSELYENDVHDVGQSDDLPPLPNPRQNMNRITHALLDR